MRCDAIRFACVGLEEVGFVVVVVTLGGNAYDGSLIEAEM